MKRVNRYEAYINLSGKKIYIGLYDSALEAAINRDIAAINYYGEYARLNFPKEVVT